MNRTLLALTVVPMACALWSGCATSTATVAGQRLPRSNFGYTDRHFFWLNHRNAYPGGRGPSSGVHSSDGSLAGRVCGADVYYDADYRGNHMSLRGYVRPQLEETNNEQIAWLEVRDRTTSEGAIREFKGGVGIVQGSGNASPDLVRAVLAQRGASFSPTRQGLNLPGLPVLALGASVAGDPVVDFRISPSSLSGRVASRRYDLHVEGDKYVGLLRVQGKTYRYEVRGAGNIWQMPAADQAAILPLMLSCADFTDLRLGEPILYTDFTGW